MNGRNRNQTAHDPTRAQMDIRLTKEGEPILFTWYKGHAFEGWYSTEKLRQAEADGVLSWDAAGNPVIRVAAADDVPGAGEGRADGC